MLPKGFFDTYNLLHERYTKAFDVKHIQKRVKQLSKKQAQVTKDKFSFYSSIASVYSSKIEGEPIELDSFIKHKFLSVTYIHDYTKRPDDLFEAYQFARNTGLTKANLLKAPAIISRHLLTKDKRGKIRTQQMFIMSKDSQIEYVAADAAIVKREFDILGKDMDELVTAQLNLTKIYFYASMLHLLFVKVHPMYDGNGRTARLLEKWFIATHLGEEAWHIESERYYYENLEHYYSCLNRLGNDYASLDYSKALPFTQLLLRSLEL